MARKRKNKSKPTQQNPPAAKETKSAKLSQAKDLECAAEKDFKIAEAKSAKGSKESKEGKKSSKADLDKEGESDDCEDIDRAVDDTAASKSDSEDKAEDGSGAGAGSKAERTKVEGKSPQKVESPISRTSETESLQESVLVRADSIDPEQERQEGEREILQSEPVEGEKEEAEEQGEEEEYVEVTHLDFAADALESSVDPIQETELEREVSPAAVTPLLTDTEQTQDDDAILEGILSGSDELSAKYRLNSEAYPDAPPSTPSEGSIPLSQLDHVSLRSSLVADDQDKDPCYDPHQETSQTSVPPPLPSPPPSPSPAEDLSQSATVCPSPPSTPLPERARTPSPPLVLASPAPIVLQEADSEGEAETTTGIPVSAQAAAIPLSSKRSSSDPLSAKQREVSSSQRRPSFKDTAEYSFMESLPNSQPPPIPCPEVESASPPRQQERALSPPPSAEDPAPLVERRVLIALTLRVLYELRLRRVLDDQTIGVVKEELFGNKSALPQAAEQFMRSKDLDPLLSAIFSIVGMEGLV